MEQYIAEITEVVRDADKHFQEKVGGGTRHWVRDAFLPFLKDAGFTITPSVPSSPAGEQDVKQEAFEFIGWILDQGYEVVTTRSGKAFAKPGTTTVPGLGHLYREFKKTED